tara:strand:+ start:1833 stop:2015 length:183 start_codon:yes stop_codon:yes gene_type:complete
LICSDGLTREVPDEEIARLFMQRLSPDETVAKLIDFALESGGRDNITTIVVDVLEIPSAT